MTKKMPVQNRITISKIRRAIKEYIKGIYTQAK